MDSGKQKMIQHGGKWGVNGQGGLFFNTAINKENKCFHCLWENVRSKGNACFKDKKTEALGLELSLRPIDSGYFIAINVDSTWLLAEQEKGY